MALAQSTMFLEFSESTQCIGGEIVFPLCRSTHGACALGIGMQRGHHSLYQYCQSLPLAAGHLFLPLALKSLPLLYNSFSSILWLSLVREN